MAYEHKPGSFTLFKNERKEKDTHPDYKGEGMDLNRNPVWVNGWKKHGKNGGSFLSISMKPKEARPPEQVLAKKPTADLDDEIPF